MSKTIKLQVYQRSCAAIQSRLASIKQKVQAISLEVANTPLTSVQTRKLAGYLAECHKRQDEFEANFRRAMESAEEEFKDADLFKDQESILDLVVDVVSLIESLSPEASPPSPLLQAQVPMAAAPVPISQVSLPKLTLKTFNGNPNEWVTYHSLFNTAVHSSTTLTAVTKMQYLIGSLSGEPLAMISSLPISAANYTTAYNILRTRYHNPRRLKMIHLNAIIWDLPLLSASSPKNWRKFINLFNEHSQALTSLDCSLAGPNPFLSAYLMNKLDQEMSKKLEAYRLQHDCEPHSLPNAEQILEFLNFECDLAEDASCHATRNASRPRSPPRKIQAPPARPHRDTWDGRLAKNVTLLSREVELSQKPSSTVKCFSCQSPEHKIYLCPKFSTLTPQDRLKQVRRLHRCISCLGNHELSACQSQSTCRKCQKRHHTFLHVEPASRSSQEPPVISPSTQSSSAAAAVSPHVALTSQGSSTICSTVLLGTTLVHLKAANGHSQVFRAIIDSGSTSSFISEHAAQSLNTPRFRSNLQVAGISSSASHTKGFLRLDVNTLSGELIAPSHTLHILEKISVHIPRATVTPEVLQLARAYLLADPSFHLPGPVDILLGADLFTLLFTQEQHCLGPHLPTMLGTRFGFIVMGPSPCFSSPATTASSHHAIALLSTSDMDLHTSLQKFWTLEEPPQCTQKSTEEVLCDEHFLQTHTRTPEGRYCVHLPFKAAHPPLGASQSQAEKRFFALERKFKAQPHFSELYHSFMQEYETRGHMTKATSLDLNSPHYFLPHHGILKGSGDSTKIRTVFDASAKTSSGVSLNDIILTGPKLQSNICDLLLNFRSHKVVFTCDVEQMYRQILVAPENHQYQLILWRKSPSLPLEIYKLLTVTYGTSCAPYLAIKTLHQLAEDEGTHFPAAAKVLREQTYVDDILGGCDTLEEARQLQQDLIALLQRGGFVLKKWTSNHPELLLTLPPDHIGIPAFLENGSQTHLSVLGLRWSPQFDHFMYALNLPNEATTKRQILSLIAQIYDPCGFLAPVTMRCKIFMQALWTLGLDWDAPIPAEYLEKWQSLHKELPLLSKIKVSRPLSIANASSVELHGFSDASESGYAAVIYIRCLYPDNTVAVWQILAKTRVAPLKKVTLPRLELCGAHLLAQLARYALSTLSHIKFTSHHLWCDSSIVLTWLRTPPYRLKTFVANRVAQIMDWVPSHYFHHVEGALNPADCASRGIPPSQLRYHDLWWSGPPWLHTTNSCWSTLNPTQALSPEMLISAQEEFKTLPLTALISTPVEAWVLFSKFSSWDRLQRVLALVLRFVDNARRPQDRRCGLLTVAELRNARLTIVRVVQRHSFLEDVSALQRQMPPCQRLRRLSPFLDEDGLLRVGGRLANAPLPPHSKHPILLPKDHPVVDLIIDSHHVQQLHAGPQLTQAALSHRYWILSARSKIRSRIFKCITCFKQRPRFSPPLMADLPSVRVTPSKPFASTGIDYAGPFNIKVLNLRRAKQVKVYLCIFICLVTKAVHLEVVTDLTTEAFLAALSRFISRRGRCSHLYSDCGTNFVGAASELSGIVQSLKSHESQSCISQFTAPLEINFHFNPPSAPHFGGLWESAVKSAKHHLKRVMGGHILTLQEFITLVTRVEAMLNSRPLTPLPSDPCEFAVLTPGHFLTGEPLTSMPEENFQDIPTNRLRSFQLVQALHQRLWRRWQTEYLHTLQQRPKWISPQRDLRLGDLVLISTPSPPLTWPLGRVTALHPGADGVVRVVDVTTPRGTYRRPAVKLARLPIDA